MVSINHVAVIYDKERVYGEKLAEYLNASESFPFETRAFYEVEKLEQFCLGNEIEILIIDGRYKELSRQICHKELIVLSDGNGNDDKGSFCIYKYQEVEKIIREMVAFLSDSENIGAVIKRTKEMKIISFYSPVKRTLSTTMAIGMGQMLGKTHKTLYINMECYSGLEKLLGKQFDKDISDLMYFLESKSGNIGMLMSSIVISHEGVDILPPVKSQNDLITLSFDRWAMLLKQIEQDTDYEYIILDLSEAVVGLCDLLMISDSVVTCIDNDEVAISKLVQYEENLKETGYESILTKTKKCNVPHQHRKNGEISYLGTGELGEYISKVLQGIVNGM